jgi:hypothetical protein
MPLWKNKKKNYNGYEVSFRTQQLLFYANVINLLGDNINTMRRKQANPVETINVSVKKYN